MDVKVATQWVALLFCSGLGILLLGMGYALVWQVFKRKDPLGFEHACRMWVAYNERYDNLSKLEQTNAELQNQIADLKRELEEMKRNEP